MAWSPEKKRAMRKKRKAEAAQKEKEMGQKMLALAPPNKELRKPYPKKLVGKSKVDFGGHHVALNFPLDEIPEKGEVQLAVGGPADSMHNNKLDHVVKKIGDMSIALVYDGDWKEQSRIAGKGVKVRCDKSEKYLEFLLQVKAMVKPQCHASLQHLMDDTMRCNIIYGAQTLAHTDSFKGNCPNFLYIVGNPNEPAGALVYDKFPRFKSSIVKIRGHYFIPHSYSEGSNEFKCIGEDPSRPNKPIFYIFHKDAMDSAEPVGDLDFGVVGWLKSGKIQVIPDYEDACLYTKPLNFLTFQWKQVVEFALQKPVLKKPHHRLVTLDKTNTWHQFNAFTYRHWWIGNHLTLSRYHVFFRTIRENCNTASPIRVGPRKNFIGITSLDDLSDLAPTYEDPEEFTD